MHWCAEETAALLAVTGSLGVVARYAWLKLTLLFKRKASDCPCGHEGNEQHF